MMIMRMMMMMMVMMMMVMMIDIWGLTGPSGTIWDHMSPYRTI